MALVSDAFGRGGKAMVGALDGGGAAVDDMVQKAKDGGYVLDSQLVSKAAELDGNIDTAGWQTFDLIRNLPQEHQATAREILDEVHQAISSDEHVVQLAPALKGAQAKAMRLLTQLVKEKTPVDPVEVVIAPTKPPVVQGKRVVGQDTKQNLTLSVAKETLSNIEVKLQVGQTARVNLSWVIEEGGES